MKRPLLTAGIVILAVLGVAGWMYYSITHLSMPISAVQTEDMKLALKGTLGEAMFGSYKPQEARITERTGLNALLAPSPAPQGEGLIAAYQKEPEKFKRYSQLFDTAMNGKRIGEAVQANRANYKFPLISSTLAINADERVDAWGHPYCVTALKTSVAVVSGGPDSKSFACEQQQIRAQELASASREIFQTSSGEVVIMVSHAGVQGAK